MEGSFLSVLVFGFVLGIKHAVEPDHVIAVSTIASKSKNIWRSSLSGVFWGAGHTATLLVAGIVLLLMKDEIPRMWAMSLEFLVGIMLVYLGTVSLFTYKTIRPHSHVSDRVRKDSSYIKSVLIGFVHGLAGSAAMVILAMSSVSTVWEGVIYILIFGAGTVTGMLACTTVIGIPFALSAKHAALNQRLSQAAGWISVAFGLFYMYNLGVTEGLFRLWMQ
ncbi:sulfite exporter TauE/SafE family protein [Paenibacillus thermotolerans]|uniref:urease accessory protein UreH domain-containing protein n=1 Tax=Paenibacillus thermotolerans TaxID=3027807 RepID=UPI0023684ECB|nr:MULTISPECIES: sulfite exporter TauE/SafE family protein [unclassified Paenibacillus]